MRGEGDTRDEIITTSFSHPSDAACAKVAGYNIITLPPDRDGYPDFEALKAAISQRTAGLLMTNPEDTGIFNPDIKDFVDLAHENGALCFYDQANANGILGITRAREAGFDLCHFNLHKTFSTPHGCGGPAAGALGVTEELAQFLPTPVVACDNGTYRLDYDRPNSIGKVGAFHGSAGCVIRAYAWAMSLGADGMKTAAEVAVLNNNYFLKKVLEIPGATAPYAPGKYRIEQVRYSWEELDQGHGRALRGARGAGGGLRRSLLDQPSSVRDPGADDARADRVLHQGGARRVRRDPARRGPGGPRQPGQDQEGAVQLPDPPGESRCSTTRTSGPSPGGHTRRRRTSSLSIGRI